MLFAKLFRLLLSTVIHQRSIIRPLHHIHSLHVLNWSIKLILIVGRVNQHILIGYVSRTVFVIILILLNILIVFFIHSLYILIIIILIIVLNDVNLLIGILDIAIKTHWILHANVTVVHNAAGCLTCWISRVIVNTAHLQILILDHLINIVISIILEGLIVFVLRRVVLVCSKLWRLLLFLELILVRVVIIHFHFSNLNFMKFVY